MSSRFQTVWAVLTGLLCLLVVAGLAFTGPLALVGVGVVLAVSYGFRWLVMRFR